MKRRKAHKSRLLYLRLSVGQRLGAYHGEGGSVRRNSVPTLKAVNTPVEEDSISQYM